MGEIKIEIFEPLGQETINEDLFKCEYNYVSDDQLLSGIKVEFHHKEDATDEFSEEKIDYVNVEESKDIIDHFIHNQGNMWKNDGENWEQCDVKVAIESLGDMAKNTTVNSIDKKERRDTSTLDGCKSYTYNLRTRSILMESRDPDCTLEVNKIESNNDNLEQDKNIIECESVKHHVEAEHKYFKCGICDYETNNKFDLVRHVDDVHLKLKYFECDKCDYKARRKSVLALHVNCVHLKLKNFKCDKCDYKAHRKSALAYHVICAHLKLKNFKCDMCDYEAHTKSLLVLHVNGVHLKLKNFKCDKCDYKAHTKSSLTYHVNAVHLKLKRFKCEKCEYKAYTKSILARHVKTDHLKLTNWKLKHLKCLQKIGSRCSRDCPF